METKTEENVTDSFSLNSIHQNTRAVRHCIPRDGNVGVRIWLTYVLSLNGCW